MAKVITGSIHFNSSGGTSTVTMGDIKAAFDWSDHVERVWLTVSEIAEIMGVEPTAANLMQISRCAVELGSRRQRTNSARYIQVPSVVND
jgi:hypothetical protein